ncbi:MAG TPA: DNA-binding response regulator, partial [Thermoanaerobaculia bacterium]|nr:DNA-binding response regulator [Thermoanaerobaculia bacterium]
AGADTCVHALECGADDCVTRTISGRELIARIRSVLRRTGPKHDQHAVIVSLSEMRVRMGNTVHNLSRGETALLTVLLQHAPTPVPITRLVQLLGARRSTIETQIKSLRRKLGPGRLISRAKLGYQWVGD